MNEATINNIKRNQIKRQEARRRAEMKRAIYYIVITLAIAAALLLAGYGDSLALSAGDIH